MKKILSIIIAFIIAFVSIWGSIAEAKYHKYITWPRWGCYYINSHGNKTYVDRNKCK